MASTVSFNPIRAFDADGTFSAGAKAYFYETGTTTPLTVYSDSGLTTPHTSPLVANSEGRFAAVYTDGSVQVRVVVTDAADVALDGYPIDPCLLVGGSSAASGVAFTPTANNLNTNVQAAIEELDDWAGKTPPSGAVIGTTDTQTLTNKTLTSPAISAPTGIDDGDIGAAASATNYTPTASTVEGHLAGIDAALVPGAWELVETTYDFSVDGAVASFESANMADGYIYAFSVAGLWVNAIWNLQADIYQEGLAAYVATANVSLAARASGDDFTGWLELPLGRVSSEFQHLVGSGYADSNITIGSNSGTAANVGNDISPGCSWSCAVADKVQKIKFLTPAGTFSGGQVHMWRRAV